MTTINNIQDLIQLLRNQPHWADELRGILLSEELRDLPAAVRDLAQAVRESAEPDRPAPLPPWSPWPRNSRKGRRPSRRRSTASRSR